MKLNKQLLKGRTLFAIVFTLICFLVVAPTISAWDWDNVVVEANENPNTGYPNLEIKNAFGLGETLFEGSLTEHTEKCSSDCVSKLEFNHQGGVLIDDIKFLTLQEDESWIEQDVRSFNMKYEAELPQFETECDVVGQELNGTDILDCNQIQTGTYGGYLNYNIGEELPVGNYVMYIEGEKKPSRTVDWQIKIEGKWLEEWAVWGNISEGDDAEVILHNPTDEEIYLLTNVLFNATANVTSGASLTNMSLWTNETGSWEQRNTTAINDINTSEEHGYDIEGGTSNSINAGWVNGMKIVMANNRTLTGITKNPSSVATWAILSDSGLTQLANASFSGNTASFDYDLTAGTTYYVLATNPDASWLRFYDETSVTFPVVETDFNWTSGRANAVDVGNIAYVVTGISLNESYTTYTETWNRTITDETLWNVQACDSDGDCGFASSNFTVNIDSTAPSVVIDAPTTNMDYIASGENETLNWTITDGGTLDDCWYSYNGTNTTVTCGDAGTTFPIEQDVYSLTMFANDSVGNTNSSTVNWNYSMFKESETFDASVSEGSQTTFTTNIITNGSQVTLATLVYNSTEYTGGISNSGNNYTITKTISAPTVDTDTNLTFYWALTTDGGVTANSSSQNQTVLDTSLDNCSTNSIVLYNFTIKSEQAQATLNGTADNTTGDLDLQLYSLDRSLTLIDYSTKFNETNPFAVCLNDSLSAGEQYVVDVQVQYDADGYASEFYNIQNATVDSSSLYNNITLYDLNDDDAQEFKVTYKDTSFLPVGDALVVVTRKYIDEGVFKTVEIAKTDSDGETLVHLEISDVIYTFNIIKNGETLETISNVIAKCNNVATGDCEINFNSFSSTIDVEDYTTLNDFSFTLTYDDDTRIIESVYSIPSGTPSTVSLNATLFDGLGNTTVCSDSLTSASGTLQCTVPSNFGNATVIAKITQDGSLISQGSIRLEQDASDIYGSSIVFLGLFLILTVIGVGISGSPMVTGVFLMLGAVISLGMNMVDGDGFIGATATILWLFIAIIVVLIKGSKRQ